MTQKNGRRKESDAKEGEKERERRKRRGKGKRATQKKGERQPNRWVGFEPTPLARRGPGPHALDRSATEGRHAEIERFL